MSQYIRRTTDVVEATQWFSPADHEKVGWYQHPEVDGQRVHERCKHKWADHGWVEPGWAYHPTTYFVGDLVCPGDYLIHRMSRVQVCPRGAFEKLYKVKEETDAAQPAGEG